MPHKRCKRSQRRQVNMGIGHNTHLGRTLTVEHPGRNLKPTVGIGTAKITAKNNSVRPVDRFVNSDLKTKPRMPICTAVPETQCRGCSPVLLYNEERPYGAIGQKPPITLLNHDGVASPPT